MAALNRIDGLFAIKNGLLFLGIISTGLEIAGKISLR